LTRSPQLYAHLFLSLIFLASRVALLAAGVRFNFILDWMWLGDPADLRDRLLETLVYFHAYPPGMNLITGILLKLGESHAATSALMTFWIFGLVLVNSLFYLARVLGLSTPAALSMAAAFSLLPQSIYFEHLYLYDHPTAALLCLAAVFFFKAVRRESFWAWFAFFGVCATISFIRTTFHLVWFVAMIALAVWCSTGRYARRRVLAAALGPAVLLLSVYVKNLVLFGAFAAFTFGPANQFIVTVERMPGELRDAWIEEGKLSRFAAISVDAGPREFLPFFEASESDEWPPQLDLLERPSVNAPNYNHWWLLEVNRARRGDALYYVQTRPLEYAGSTLEGFGDMFGPSTEWHPRDATGASPHAQHRDVLGRYEVFYNRIVHGILLPPVGLYVFLPLVVVWAFWHARSLVRADDMEARARGLLLYFCLIQIGFVVAASSLFTFRESARYRFPVESMMWLITGCGVVSLWRSLFNRVASVDRTL
jgi:4-amino-4-deoxy-L-arabinose transferase-like glycosyltransferase